MLILLVHKHLSWTLPLSALPSSSRVISLHGGHRHLIPPRLRQEKAFFSLHWWNGCSSALYSKKKKTYKKTEFIFSVHPYSNLLAKMFFYWFGRPGVFLSVWMCIYIDVHVWQNKLDLIFFVCVLVLFQCRSFYCMCEWFAALTCSTSSKAFVFVLHFFFFVVFHSSVAVSGTLCGSHYCCSNGRKRRKHCLEALYWT